jgi:hypothetical protein
MEFSHWKFYWWWWDQSQTTSGDNSFKILICFNYVDLKRLKRTIYIFIRSHSNCFSAMPFLCGSLFNDTTIRFSLVNQQTVLESKSVPSSRDLDIDLPLAIVNYHFYTPSVKLSKNRVCSTEILFRPFCKFLLQYVSF